MRVIFQLIFLWAFLLSPGLFAETSEIKSELNFSVSWEDAFKKYDTKTPSLMIGIDKSWGFYYTDYLQPSFSLRAATDISYLGQFRGALVMGVAYDWALTRLRPSSKIYMGSGIERRRFKDGDSLIGAFYVIGINQQFIYFYENKRAYLGSFFFEASPTSDLNSISVGIQFGQGTFER